MAWLAISLINVVIAGPTAVGDAAPGADVADIADGAGMLVGENGEVVGNTVGNSDSVAVAMGEQAASPPSIPSAPTFKASLREIFLVMAVPLKVIYG